MGGIFTFVNFAMPMSITELWLMKEEKAISTCRQCGINLQGRIDKKFCNDSCRTLYHNQRQAPPMHVREINQALMRNRQIILELLGENRTTLCSKKQLFNLGFSAQFFTGSRESISKSMIRYCYETGFLRVGSESYLLFIEDMG